MHTKKFKIKLDNSFILTQSHRCQVHRAKSFHQDDLEHAFVFVTKFWHNILEILCIHLKELKKCKKKFKYLTPLLPTIYQGEIVKKLAQQFVFRFGEKLRCFGIFEQWWLSSPKEFRKIQLVGYILKYYIGLWYVMECKGDVVIRAHDRARATLEMVSRMHLRRLSRLNNRKNNSWMQFYITLN